MQSVDFEQVFAALPSPFMLLDRDLHFVTANPAYLAATGRGLDGLRGQHVMDAFPNAGESGERLRASLEKVVATGRSDTLAYLPYPIPLPDGSLAERYWTVVHTPILAADGSTAFVMQNTVDVTEVVRLRDAAAVPFPALPGQVRLLERTLEAEEANRELLRQSEDFRQLFQQAPGFVAVLTGAEHVFTFASDSTVRLVGGRQVVGHRVRDVLPEVVEQGFVDLLDRVFVEGRPHAATGARVMLGGEPGAPFREVYIDFSFNPVRGPDGTVTGVFAQGTDQTESFTQQRRLRLMLDELNHRVKNALATVQSIAAQTFRATPDIARARADFESRLQSLASAHGMLSERQWEDAELGALVRQELDAYGPGHIDVQGPYVVVGSKAAIGLTLALHELSSNAARYGALSAGSGKVTVRWRIESERELVLSWQESGGPVVAPPERRGFGSRLVARVIAGELGGVYEPDYDTAGFRASIRVPAREYHPVEAGHVF